MCEKVGNYLAALHQKIEVGLAAQGQTASVRDSALSGDIRDRVQKEREEAWQALRIEFDATQTNLLDSVRVATAGTPAEVVDLWCKPLKAWGLSDDNW